MSKPFAITLSVGTSLANRTGSWRTERPVYADSLPRPEEQTTFYDFAAAEADAWLALAPWRVRVCAPLCASICLM